MSTLYPLKFKPIPREMVWGGSKLQKLYNKSFPADSKIGESWEISGIGGAISIVENGRLEGNNLQELIEIYMGDLIGEKVFEKYGIEFPLLIKLIDATDDLSIQVHPDDQLAARRHNSFGKTEMWYVLEAEPDAELITGFNREVNAGVYKEKLKSGKLLELMNIEKVQPEDVYFIPAGRVHAIRKGIVLAEIQQTSDITYRIYDWDRLDDKGNSRQLHIDEAMEAIDFGFHDDYRTIAANDLNVPVLLADCEYFTVNRIRFDKKVVRDYILIDSFIIYICTGGEFNLAWGNESIGIKKGETVLIPADLVEVTLTPKESACLLEVYIK
jgi:mannose-6-phosphate isomerase